MNDPKLFLAGVTIPLACACTAEPDLDFTTLPATPIKSRILTEFPTTSDVRDLEVVAEGLVVLDSGDRSALYLIDKNTGEFLATAVPSDTTVGALRRIAHMDAPGFDATSVWLYDVRERVLIEVPIDSLRAGNLEGRAVPLATEGIPTDTRWIGDSLIVSPGIFEEGRIVLHDENGAPFARVGDVPGTEDGGPVIVRQQAHQARARVSPDGRVLVLANRNYGTLELHDADGSASTMVDGPFPFSLRYEVQYVNERPIMRAGSGLRYGYVDLAVTDEEIFALFSGRVRGEWREEATQAPYIHVFRWDGAFREAYALDLPLHSIAVDPEDGTVFGLRTYPRPALLKLELSPNP